MGRQHSVFVYGTLRPGQGNHRRLLAGRTVQETPAFATGLALYGTGFPYAVPQPGARIVGDLITIEPTRYREVLADLDALEGYDARQPATSHYIRTTRSVVANQPPARRRHLAGAPHGLDLPRRTGRRAPAGMPRITDDDWLADRS